MKIIIGLIAAILSTKLTQSALLYNVPTCEVCVTLIKQNPSYVWCNNDGRGFCTDDGTSCPSEFHVTTLNACHFFNIILNS